MPKLSRRGLLIGGGLAAVAAPTILAFDLLIRPHHAITAHLRRLLPHLAVETKDILVFAEQFLRETGGSLRHWREMGTMSLAFAPALIQERLGSHPGPWSEELLTKFLFSTDFFGAANRDPTKTRYVAYADPWALGCANPLSAKI